jgi:endonuclease YncB( thermonuclease family)/uncharacterized membrane protein YkvA (DUF1232 family)
MKLRGWIRLAQAGRLKVYLLALWKLFRHPATPWFVKAVAVAVVAYAVSPIDLIPDFIPVLGQLDDLLLLPLGVALAVWLTPPALWAHCLREAEAGVERLPRLRWGAAVIVLLWLAALALGLGLALWMLAAPAQAGQVAQVAQGAPRQVPGQVSRVVDGDTLWFQPAEPGQPLVAVRLRGIDAPENCQPWGRQATVALREQVQGRPAALRIHGQDDYRRTLGTVYVAGLDINAALVAQGHAWAWRDSRGRSPYLKQEATARAAGRGAHADRAAEAPWDFRRRHGRCRR